MTILDLVTFIQVMTWVYLGLIARDLGRDILAAREGMIA